MPLPEPALYMLREGLMEADRVGSRDTPVVCSGLGSFCRINAEPRRQNTKKEVLKGKKRKRTEEGRTKEQALSAPMDAIYAKKQLTKTRLNKDEK